MVKNLSTIDRSSKVRLGRHATDDQADNTIVINASNAPISAQTPGSLYMTPLRTVPGGNTKILGYDPTTKEILNTNIDEPNIIAKVVDFYANIGNTFTSTIVFEGENGLITTGNVGISNTEPIHTLDVGSNLWVDDTGSTVLNVTGGVHIDGNLDVEGQLTVIESQNLRISDAIIEVGKGNTTADVGMMFDHQGSNVVVGYKDNELIMAHTQSSADQTSFTANTANPITAHVYGYLVTQSNVGVINTNPIHTLDVGSNLYVDDVASNVLYVKGATDLDGNLIVYGNAYIEQDLHVKENAYVTQDLTVTENVLVSNNLTVTKDLTVNNDAYITQDLTVTENVFVSNNITVTKDLEVVENVLVSNNLTVTKDVEVVENVLVSNNLTVTKDLTVNDNAYVTQDLTVTENVLVSNNLTVTKDMTINGNVFFSNNLTVAKDLTVNENVYVTQDLTVTENVLVSNNLTVTKDLTVNNDAYVTQDLTVTENVLVSNNLTVTKDLIVNNNAYITQDLTVTENVFVSNNLTVNKDLTVNDNVYVTQDLTVTENVLVSNNVYVTQELTVTENVLVSNNLTVTKDLTVNNDAYVTQDLTVTENVFVSNNLTVTKDLTVNNDAYITQDLTVTENVFVSNNITVTKDLEVVENVLVSNNLTVTKDVEVVENVLVSNNLTVTKDLTVNDNVYVTQDLTVTENVLVSNNLTVTKDLTVNDNVYVTQDLTVTENVLVSNNLTVTKDLIVNDNVYVTQDLTVTENVFVSNNLTVTKDVEVVENVLVSNNLTVTKDLTVNDNVYVTQDLTVTENVLVSNNLTVTKDLTVNDNAYVTQDLTVTENVLVSNNLTVTKDMTINGNVFFSNNLTVAKDLTVNENVYVTQDLTVTENVLVSNNLTVTKDLTVNNDAYVTQDLTVTENVFVSNNLTVTKDVEVVENVLVSNNLTVTKDLTVNDNVYVTQDLTVTENVLVSNNLTVTKDLIVNNDAYITQDLTVTENVFVSNNLMVTKDVEVVENVLVSNNLTVTKDLTVNDNVYVTQDLTVTENVLVSNNLTVAKDLTVNENVYVTQDLTVTENVLVSNNLTVTKDLTVNNDAYVTQDLTVTENVFVSNNLTVTKDVEVVENVLVSNNLTVTKDLTVNDNVYVTQDLTVTENVLVSNNLTVTKDLTVNDNAYVTQDLTVTENVLVSNNLTVTKDMSINGNVFFSNNLTVAKDLTVNENVYVTQDLTVTENVLVSNNLTVTKDLIVNNDAYITQDLTVTENVFVSNNLTVTKDVEVVENVLVSNNLTVTKDLTVTENVFVSNNLTVNKDLTVNDNVYVTQDLTVTENVLVSNNLTVTKDLIVNNDAYITQDLTVTENVLVSNNLTVTKDLTVNDNAYVTQDLTVTENVFVSNNLTVTKNSYVTKDLTVTENVFVSNNLTVTKDTTTQDIKVTTLTSGRVPFVDDNKYLVDSANFTYDTSNNKLTVTGDIVTTGNMFIQGETTYVSTENLVVNDAIIGIANNNTSDTLDMGIIMQRLSSNVVIGYRGDESEIIMAHTLDGFSNIEITPDTSNLIDVHVYGRLKTDTNVDVGSNIYITDTGSAGLINVIGNVTATTFNGDGGLLSNIDLQVVSDKGNTTTQTVQFTNPTTAFTTDLTSNVELKLNQLSNVNLETLSEDQLLVYDGANWVNDYNVHNFVKIKNNTGADLLKGQAVYVKDGWNANVSNVALAQSDSSNTMPSIGVIHDTVASGGEGVAVAYGKIQNIDTSNFEVGQTVYVSNTVPGGLMSTKPYGLTDQIQNVGICLIKSTQQNPNKGTIFVTGVGRSNDIPNAQIVQNETAINYVYVNDTNNDLKKIVPSNLLTQLQTLQQVTDTSNSTSNIVRFTNATTGFETTSNAVIGSNISITGLTQKFIPFVGDGNFLQDSSIKKDNGNIIITADTEITGNLLINGNTYTVSSSELIIDDRIIAIANNNPSHDYDEGIIMFHPGHNVALIHHGDEDRFSMGYTQNTVTATHILPDAGNTFALDVLGTISTQNSITVREGGSYFGDGGTLSNVTLERVITLNNTADSTVIFDNKTAAFVTNVYSNTGIANLNPIHMLDVGANVYVEDGAAGGTINVIGNVTATNYIGDGGTLSNVTLERVITLNNTADSTVIFDNKTAAFVTNVYSNTGIGNLNPTHMLDVGANVYVDSISVNVTGNVVATRFIGDGSFLDNIASTLEEIITNGNTTSNTVIFDNTTAALVTNVYSNTGIANLNPIHTLDIGSNVWFTDTENYKLNINGNAIMKNITLDSITLGTVFPLQSVTRTGNTTSNTVEFRNDTTGLVTTSNAGIANINVVHTLD